MRAGREITREEERSRCGQEHLTFAQGGAFSCGPTRRRGKTFQRRISSGEKYQLFGACRHQLQPLPLHTKRLLNQFSNNFGLIIPALQITEYNSQNNLVQDSVILCSHFSPRPGNSRNSSVFQSQGRNY